MEFTIHRLHKRLILKLVLHCKFYRLFRKKKSYVEKQTYDFSLLDDSDRRWQEIILQKLGLAGFGSQPQIFP